MKTQPIRQNQKVIQMLDYLRKNNPYRDYVIFLTGISTALRISEILNLRYSDIFKRDNSYKKYVRVMCKGKKPRDIQMSSQLRREIREYCKKYKISGDGFLFMSQKGNRLSRKHAWALLKKAATACGIENFGTHSMRKTFARKVYLDNGNNLGLVMDLLDHSDPKFTLRYLGITQEDVDKVTKAVSW